MNRPAIQKVVEPPVRGGQVPPHDLDAEAAVLSAVFLRPGTVEELAGRLDAEDFYSEANANAYVAAVALAAVGKPTDTVHVAGWLRDRGRLEGVGGPAYLAQIVDAAPAVANVVQYAGIVRDKRLLRRVIAECHRIAAEGYGDVGEPTEWAAEAEAAISKAAAREDVNDRTEHIQRALERVAQNMVNRLEGKVAPGVSTGLTDLDRCLNFMRPGNVVVIGARSHVGKSSLARQIAANVAGANGGPRQGVLVWSGEQPNDESAECMQFQNSGLSEAKIRALQKITQEDWKILTSVSCDLSRSPFFLNDTPAIGPMQLRAVIRRWKRDLAKKWPDVPPTLVVCDYVQLMSAAGLVNKNSNREGEVAAISRKLKEIALAEKVIMVVLAQLNKASETRKDDAKPRPGDLRESNALEQDADKIILIHNPNAIQRMQAFRDGSKFELPNSEVAELIVGKARGGGTMGTVRVTFFPGSAQFTDFRGE